MSKTHMSRPVLLTSAVIALLSTPAFAQMMAPPSNGYMPPSTMPMTQQPVPMPQNYARPPLPPQPGSLGTLEPGDMPEGQQAPPPYVLMPPPAHAPMQQADSYNSLQPMQNGEIRYVTGGIGDEERNAMHDMEKDYDLHIMSASKSGAFTGDTQIRISSSKGTELLTTVAGPLFYADLPSGKYTLEAMNDGQTKRQTVTIVKGRAANVHLSW